MVAAYVVFNSVYTLGSYPAGAWSDRAPRHVVIGVGGARKRQHETHLARPSVGKGRLMLVQSRPRHHREFPDTPDSNTDGCRQSERKCATESCPPSIMRLPSGPNSQSSLASDWRR